MKEFRKSVYRIRNIIEIPPSVQYCATWEAHNEGNIKMSLDGFIDFTEELAGRSINTGASIGTITGYYIAGDPDTVIPASVSMTFTATKGNFSTDSLPVITDTVLSSIKFYVEVICTDASEISFPETRLDGEVTGVGQVDSYYNSCSEGIAINIKRGQQFCLGGICTLNDSIVDVTVYTDDGTISDGKTIYTNSALNIPYLTSNFLKEDLGIEVYGVDGSGTLYINCLTDEGC